MSEEQVAKMTICPRHTDTCWAGFGERQGLVNTPVILAKKTFVTGRHVVNFQMASEISILFDKTIPVGSRKYHSFFFFMQKRLLNVH